MAVRIDQDRPSPDALLEQANKEGRGKLRIFLGAAPGVGKTFEMLTQGRRRRLDGADIVIGVVETHGRPETEALTKGFEIVPKKRSLYKGRVIAEMDLDAILQRKPQLVLVDELAHTNLEGSRHPKRYLDVEEMLAAGIDVFTTINIQHIDSLNDVIAQITRIRVRETVPDAVLDEADEIELVDLTAEDLLARLREGKVYVKAQAERALNHFFSPGNLTALRELALRKVAQHVDHDMVDYMQAHAIGGPWPAGERILVCVSEHPSSAELVRYGRRVAAALKAEWTALHIESSRHATLSEGDKDRVADTLRLAQRLGGQAASLPGRDIAESILNYAHRNNITQIVIVKSMRPFWFELLDGSVVRDLIRNSGAISITTVSPHGEAIPAKSVRTAPRPERIAWRGYLLSAAAVAGTVCVAWVMNAIFVQSLGSVGMVFLVPVLVSAVFFGRWPAFITALLSVMAYNFFFLPPLYTFTIADPNNWLSFAVLLFVAIIAGNLAARVRAQADLAAARATAMTELYRFTGKLAGIARLDDILWAAAFQISSMLKTNVVILLENSATNSLEVRAGYPPEDELDAQDLAAAAWCWGHGQPAGRNAETLPGAKRLFLPMRTGEGLVAVAGLQRPDDRTLFTPDERRLLDALLDQAALAIERSRLVERVDEAQVLAEADKLRVAMLTSLSHDLRTPLASVLGAATTLIANRSLYDSQQTDELLTTIREEAERLDRFVGNLLDMSRLEAGALGVKREALDVRDLVDAATERLARRLSTHKILIDLPADLPLVRADPLLLEQAIFNLLDNAAKYSPLGSRIRVHARAEAARVLLTIEDEGTGIAPDALPHIFEKFYRAKASDSRVAGTGLGLAVARGFVEAFGGRLDAANRIDRSGADLTISLPIAPIDDRNHGSQII
jgi:two-component system, OmpR family, sensor histidine kinase KdpD